jgi:hypothetical protein
MSKYENWEFTLVRLADGDPKFHPVQNYQTKEDLYQEFKERLIEELLVDSKHLPEYATLKDIALDITKG